MKAKINLLLSGLLLVCMITLIYSCSDDDSNPDPTAPTASFTASKTTAAVGEEIVFTNTSTDAVSYAWSFGDATTSTAESPTKSYTVAGVYDVTLIATGPGGTDEETMEITIAEPELGEIYVISYADEIIQKFSVEDPSDLSTFLDVAGFSGAGLAYNATTEKIYFSDFYDYYVGKIWSIDADGTAGDEVAIVEDLYEPYSIAIDEAAGKIYYADGADDTDADEDGNWDDTDYDESHIYRANLDGSGAVAVVTMQNALFRPLAIDPENDKMYFYDVYDENLYMADLDGTNQVVILEGVYGYAIAVDTENNKIYFDEQNSGELKMDNLDGTYPLTPVTVDAGGSRIYGIVIDNEIGKLYWSARDDGAIYQSDLDGSNKITLKDGLTQPRGMFLKK